MEYEFFNYFYVSSEGECCYLDLQCKLCENSFISAETMSQLKTELTMEEFVHRFAKLLL